MTKSYYLGPVTPFGVTSESGAGFRVGHPDWAAGNDRGLFIRGMLAHENHKRKVGARGVLESMYHSPSEKKVKEIVVTPEMID